MKKYFLVSFCILISIITTSCHHRYKFHDKRFYASHVNKYFAIMDSNEDGFISKQEHKKFYNNKFVKIDKDKNYKISLEEFHNYKKNYMKKKK